MLKIEDLKKNYPGFSLDVTMQVKPGMITGLIGENGAGKSTIFKAVNGLIRPDGGRILVFGKDAAGMSEADRGKIGTVFSEAGFSGYLTVRDVRRILRAMYPDFDEAGFASRCRAFRLEESKKIKDLSTGLKARLKVLAALSHHADLLLLVRLLLRGELGLERLKELCFLIIHDDAGVGHVDAFVFKAALDCRVHGDALDLPHHLRHVIGLHAGVAFGQHRAEIQEFAQLNTACVVRPDSGLFQPVYFRQDLQCTVRSEIESVADFLLKAIDASR